MNNLLEFIRKLWNNPNSSIQDTDDEFNWTGTWSASGWHPSSKFSLSRTENLTEKEIQLLRNIVAKHIRIADQVKKEIKDEALSYEVGDDLRNTLFREHREIKEYLKKLSALQYRLKYKIKTKG